jgi:hypothetical protein
MSPASPLIRSDESVVTCNIISVGSYNFVQGADYAVVTRNSRVVTHKSHCCNDMSRKPCFRTDCTDYSVVTCKLNLRKEMSPVPP